METEEQRLKRIFVEHAENRLIKNIKKIQEGKNDDTTKTRFFALIREESDKADSKLHDCLLSEEHKSNCYADYGRSIERINDITENIKSFGKNKSFYLPCVPEVLDDDSISIVKDVNKKVDERTTYGRRNELSEDNSIVLTWSNYSKAWYPTGKAKKGEEINLDSNMILVKDIKDKSKLGHAVSCLKNHPLSAVSFEAIYERKETPFLPGLLTWVERQIQMKKEIEERKKQT
jgi:hypothetical protein